MSRLAHVSARLRARLLVAGGLLALLLVQATAEAAKIKGKLENFRELVNPVWQEAKDPSKRMYSFREIVPTVPAEYRRLFPHIPKELCVAALATQAQQADMKPVLIRVGGGRTTPVTIVVAPGTRLVFRNTDPFTHRLYIAGQSTFAPSDTLQGATRDWTVPKAGSFEVRDELAPSLRMWIVAESNVAAIAYPSMAGEFLLTLALPGDYTIQTFFAGKRVGDAVPIKVEGADVDLSSKPIKVAPDPKKTAKKADKTE
jgi:hypothetical protein